VSGGKLLERQCNIFVNVTYYQICGHIDFHGM
jgi:hypothetical protein